jgi:hypothetical protein
MIIRCIGNKGGSHAILALLNEFLLVLVTNKVLLVTNVVLTIYTRSTQQHTSIQRQSCKANKGYRLEQYTNSIKIY